LVIIEYPPMWLIRSIPAVAFLSVVVISPSLPVAGQGGGKQKLVLSQTC
jgi:hypothetical protein